MLILYISSLTLSISFAQRPLTHGDEQNKIKRLATLRLFRQDGMQSAGTGVYSYSYICHSWLRSSRISERVGWQKAVEVKSPP